MVLRKEIDLHGYTLEDAITAYLRRATENFDLSKNVEVCNTNQPSKLCIYLVFLMILFETVFISCIATPIGIALSYLIITYFGKHGIDLSVVGKGMENFGVGAIVYTYLPAILIGLRLMSSGLLECKT